MAMARLRVTAAALSMMAVAQAAEPVAATSSVLAALQQLPPLPVPHYAWPFCHLESSCTAEFMRTGASCT